MRYKIIDYGNVLEIPPTPLAYITTLEKFFHTFSLSVNESVPKDKLIILP